jgi:cell division protein FtsB
MEIKKISDDEMFAQIAMNQWKMADVIQSHEAEIQRLKHRVKMLEDKVYQ